MNYSTAVSEMLKKANEEQLRRIYYFLKAFLKQTEEEAD